MSLTDNTQSFSEDQTLQKFGYQQEYKRELKRFASFAVGFSLGAFEWPIIILALIWLLFELSIFRDVSFTTPWIYSLVMFGLGLIYFLWMLMTRPKVLQTPPQGGEPNVPGTTEAG